MKVDLERTRQRFKATGRMYGPWARIKGLNASQFRNFVNGRYIPVPGGETEKRYIEKLQEDGLLVLENDDEVTAAA